MIYLLQMESIKDSISMPTHLYNRLKSSGIRYSINFDLKSLVFDSQEDLDTATNILSEKPQANVEVVQPVKAKRGKLF